MAQHQALGAWLGLSPNNRITGGRVMSSKTKASANRAAAALRLAANALHRSDSALGAFLRRKKAHLGAPKAITATAHNWPASSTPCCGTARSTWMPAQNTTRVSISIGHCALQNGGPRNSATSWCPYQMPWHRLCPTHQRLRRCDTLG